MKRFLLLCAVITMFSLFFAVPAGAQPDRWTAPSSDCIPSRIPRLSQPLVLDGSVKEWNGAACVQMLNRSHVTILDSNHKWLGPKDAGMEVYCAWNDQGLCFAAVVADSDVRNNCKVPDYWRQDCVEFFLDGRVSENFMKYPYSSGAFQLLVRPPVDKSGAQVAPNPRDGEIKGLKVAGKRTGSGYTVELLVPWSSFPGLIPGSGANIGFQFALDDYDAYDGKASQPAQVTWNAVRDPWNYPDRLIKAELVDSLPAGMNASLGSVATIDAPASCGSSDKLPVTVQVSSAIAPRVKSVRLSIAGADRRPVFTQTSDLTLRSKPWQDAGYATLYWPVSSMEDGYYTATVRFTDKDGKTIGSIRKPVLCVGKTTDRLISRLAKVDIGKLAQVDPFKAANYLGAGACIEQLKYHIQKQNVEAITATAREADARLDLLESGKLVPTGSGLLELLNLTANPDAQVVVEYPSPRLGAVTFYCGSIPMANVDVEQFTDEASARKSAMGDTGGTKPPMIEKPEPVTIAGCQGRIVSQLLEWVDFDRKDYSSDTNVMVLMKPWSVVFVFPVGMLSELDVDAVAFLESTPDSVRKSVEEWGKSRSLPTISIADAKKGERTLITGDINSPELADVMKSYPCFTFHVTRGFRGLSMVWGNRTIGITTPVRSVAERVVELLVKGTPVTTADTDAIRSDLVAALAPKGEASPVKLDTGMFCGDVHMHSFYSDGMPSPAGLVLEAMYCFMDYAVVTDHNTIAGAQLVQKSLAKNGFTFPCTVGEEITTNWVHINAYPLTGVVKPSGSVFDMNKAAHVEGATTQWNHPGYPGGDWDKSQQKNALKGTGFSAWEHIPARYDDWKAAGICPTITASTDTHDGTFSYPERTIIFAPNASGRNVAEAVRSGQTTAVSATGSHFAYGSDKYTSLLWAALADGKSLKAEKAELLQKHLKNADLVTLIKSSPAVAKE